MWPGMFQAKASNGRKMTVAKKTTMAFNRLIDNVLSERFCVIFPPVFFH